MSIVLLGVIALIAVKVILVVAAFDKINEASKPKSKEIV